MAASEYIKMRRDLVQKPTVTDNEMRDMLSVYQREMVYLKGGVRAVRQLDIALPP